MTPMKGRPKIGTVGELQFTVEQKHVIEFATDGMPAVLSTPQLIGWLERTARETVAPLLESGERTVGIEIEVRHLAPTPLGASVRVSFLSAPRRILSASARKGPLPTITSRSRCAASGLCRTAIVNALARSV
jgi:hypothetical protein